MTEVLHDRTVSWDRPGDCIVTQGDKTNWLNVITHADPIAWFGLSVLESIVAGEKSGTRSGAWIAQILTLTPPEKPESVPNHMCDHEKCYAGWKVTVAASNASYVYILKMYDPFSERWIGAWPD